MAGTVVVHSALGHAVELRLHDMVDADAHAQPSFSANVPGVKTARRTGSLTLRPGRNEVDAELWKAWNDQNGASDLAKRLHAEPERD